MVSNYKGPRATGSRLFCEYCSKQFTKASTLQMHINISHLKMKPFPCEQCGKQFSKKHEVTEHVLTHHGEYLLFVKQALWVLKSKIFGQKSTYFKYSKETTALCEFNCL